MKIFLKFTQYTHIVSVTNIDLSWLNNLFVVIFQLIKMSSYAKNKLLMCLFTQHQCRRRQIWAKLSQIHCTLTFYLLQKMTWLKNIFMVMSQLMRMFSYAKNKLQMCSFTQHQCRRRQMCGNFSQIHLVHYILYVTKNDLSWLNNLFTVIFQLIRMSSYAKNKLPTSSVTQH